MRAARSAAAWTTPAACARWRRGPRCGSFRSGSRAMRESSRPLVFGEALVDAFADGVVPGGAPFNVACHLAALGRAPRLVTRLGHDPAGDALRAAAARFGLSLDDAQADAETARVLVHERTQGHAFEIPDAQAFDRIDAADAVAVAQRAGPGAWLYFGTLALRAGPSRQALAAIRTTLPHRAYVDLNWREAGPAPPVILDLLREVHVLKLSDDELGRLLGWLGLAGPTGVPARATATPASPRCANAPAHAPCW
ncbi:MAG: hypothetical protein B7X39_10530 [Lysobacterales bacterium 14-68-21]|nr:MAG: hypothetical protein B7X45_08410 [Xanthomonadales bacterium 15-68-25]OZB66540.1 MAG: hypothetical protein B7X39_10530 [Xanthomonadales bacterium 14-68-21]